MICNECFDALSPRDREAAMAEKPIDRRKGHVRNFWALIGLSIITLTVYYFYWLYINLKEIKEGAFQNEDDSIICTAQGLFWVKIGVLIGTIIGSLIITLPLALADPYDFKFPSAFIIFPLISFVANIIFFYFFTASVSLGQRKVQLAPFNVIGIYALYLISSLIELTGGIFILQGDMISTLSNIYSWSSLASTSSFASLSLLGFLNTIGNILWLVSIFLVQKQINKIWLQGDWK